MTYRLLLQTVLYMLSLKKMKRNGADNKKLFFTNQMGLGTRTELFFLMSKPTRLGSFSPFLFYAWFKKIKKQIIEPNLCPLSE
jgi:hypothetical protein